MRRVSQKRAALNKAVKQWREDIRREVARCEMCLKPAAWDSLDVHELVVACHRPKALDKRFATLCLHRECHRVIEAITVPWQMPYLMRARRADFDLLAYHRLTSRMWPSQEDLYRNYLELFGVPFEEV